MCATVVSTLTAGPQSSGRPDDGQRLATMRLLRAPGTPPGQPGKPHTDASTVTASHTTPKHQAENRTKRRLFFGLASVACSWSSIYRMPSSGQEMWLGLRWFRAGQCGALPRYGRLMSGAGRASWLLWMRTASRALPVRTTRLAAWG